MGAGLVPGGAGGRGRVHPGGRESALERQDILGILLAFSHRLRVSVLLPQIRERRGGGDMGVGGAVLQSYMGRFTKSTPRKRRRHW